MRFECEGGPAAWLAGTLVAPSVQGHGLPPLQELWLYQRCFLFVCLFVCLFFSLLQLAIRRPLWPVFSVGPAIQAFRGLPFLGSFSVVWHIRHIEGPPWLGTYSVDRVSVT